MSVRAWGAWGVLVYCNQYLQVYLKIPRDSRR